MTIEDYLGSEDISMLQIGLTLLNAEDKTHQERCHLIENLYENGHLRILSEGQYESNRSLYPLGLYLYNMDNQCKPDSNRDGYRSYMVYIGPIH